MLQTTLACTKQTNKKVIHTKKRLEKCFFSTLWKNLDICSSWVVGFGVHYTIIFAFDMFEIFLGKIALEVHNCKVIRGINLSLVLNSSLYMNPVEKVL